MSDSTVIFFGWTRRARTIGFLGLLLIPLSAVRAEPAANPWTPERVRAVVKIQIKQGQDSWHYGTGFIVKGWHHRFYVLTSLHVMLPGYDSKSLLPIGCVQPVANTELIEGDSGSSRFLVPQCVNHLANEITVIELKPRDDPYPFLELAAHDLSIDEFVIPSGFPLGGDRESNRWGKVTRTTGAAGGLIETNALTTEGLSGAPYLNTDGRVVGIHQAGLRGSGQGFAYLTPILDVRNLLEAYLPTIPDKTPPESQVEATTEAAKQCVIAKLQEFRNERIPFSYRARIDCGPDKPKNDRVVKYDVYEEKPGYAISGFVSHKDNVRNGSVEMLRYSRLDALNTLAVEVPIACDVSGSAAGQGWAETELAGALHRIENSTSRAAIERECAAGEPLGTSH